MVSAEQIESAVHRYLELVAGGTADEIAALFADDATVVRRSDVEVATVPGDERSAKVTVAHDLALALDVADAVDAFTLPSFREADFTIDWKRNQTEVTEIDRRAETMIVDRLVHERPSHGAFGEEHGLAVIVSIADGPERSLQTVDDVT